ncbi:hypothetical protein B566_EDAN012894, partial [Ephemera danica]
LSSPSSWQPRRGGRARCCKQAKQAPAVVPPKSWRAVWSRTNNNNNSLKLTSSTRLSSTTMKIDTSDTNDIFGCVRFGSGNGFGTNKGRPSMISAKYRLKEERRKVLKISIGKLKRIEDPESSLCRSVLINNTMKRLQREAREEKLQRQGIYPQQSTPTHVAFERSPVDDLKPMVSIEPVPRSAVTLSVSNPCSNPTAAAAPASNSPSAACSVTITSSTTTTACTTTVATASRKRSTSDVECDECDVQDVLSHFYMPPTPRLLTSIDDEDEVVPPKRQRLMESTTETNNNNNNTSVQLSPSIEQLPSMDSSLSNSSTSPPPPPTHPATDDVSTPCTTERLQSELCCTSDVTALNSRSADETEQMDTTSIIHERLTQLSDDDEDEVIDVVNETSSPTFDSSAAAEFCRTSNEIIRMDAVSEVLSSNRIRDFCTTDESTRYPTQRANSLSVSQSNQVTNVGVNSNTSTNPCSNNSSATSVLDANEQQHFSCGHSSIFGELQSVVFHSLIASLES